MPVVNPEKLVKLQHCPDLVRNICVLAHVDHGKTSLTDSLIATNGIISPRMAGKVRYLDSRPDEQSRGITMESSAISLFFSILRKSGPDSTPERKDYLINLIDSPGHVDFSSEVSTASRLCDGAVVLVDAVEGVCSQTVAVLRQSWIEHLKPVLVINKMDRLITELRMSAGEAYTHLSRLIEQVNAVMGSFFQGERMEADLRWRERIEERVSYASNRQNASSHSASVNGDTEGDEDIDLKNISSSYEEKDDEDIYFDPAKGNVIFCSAIDGWAFTVKQFASFYEKKLGIKRAALEKVLWGDFYLDPKTKKVLGPKHLKGRALKPIFVQLVLDNVWAVYEATIGGDKGKGDQALVEKITKALALNLPGHILRSRDPRAILTALCAAWIPLSTAVLVTVIENLPSPNIAQAVRIPGILDASPGALQIDTRVRDAMSTLKRSETDPVVAFVSKMVAVPAKELPENKSRSGATLTAEEARDLARKKRAEIARAQAHANSENADVAELREALRGAAIDREVEAPPDNEDSEDEPEHLIGFARLYAGTLAVGDEIFVLSPKFSPATPRAAPEPQKVTVTGLYLLMGRSLESLTSVPAGVVFGIAGLEGHILKSGTLCSQVEGGVNLAGVNMGSQPIVRVALEPENPQDLDKMITGLRLLEQSDPCAAYEVLENGEHVIVTAGELHLERCLKDLRERFARCEIQTGAPIVPYRETIINATEMNPPREKDLPRGTVVSVTTSKQISVRLRVQPLPSSVTEYLQKHAPAIRRLYSQKSKSHGTDEVMEESGRKGEEQLGTEVDNLDAGEDFSVADLKIGLQMAFKEVKNNNEIWKRALDRIVAFGPHQSGGNILIDLTSQGICTDILFERELNSESSISVVQASTFAGGFATSDICPQISYAFQLAMAQGPLCSEQVQGVTVFLEDVSLLSNISDSDVANRGRLTSEVIKTVRASIHQGFLDWSPRLLLAMYSCEIQASTEVLGRVYGVITRRRGRILSESMNEGTPFFTIVSVLPVAESFGFSDEIRKRTSGAASPQLIFQGYEMLDMDPFWVPSTEEELEDLGDIADRENVAKKYMDGVRTRKGLFVAGKKLLEDAEKQKTLKKN